MALPASGQITLDQIHVEAGGTSTTEVTINDVDVRALIGASSGQANLSFSDFYGASATVTINITITGNTNNYNIFNSKGGSYVAGKTTVNLTINSGVTVGSTSTGTYALDTGSGWASGDVINIVNNGTVKGRGGNGGAGGNAVFNSTAQNGANGGTGGPAFRAQFACTFTNNGSVYGGGGGGGGGFGSWGTITIIKSTSSTAVGGGGGGGGAGVNGGTGGAGGTASGGPDGNTSGAAGGNGTATAGGAGTGISGPGNPSGAGGGLGVDGLPGSNPTVNLPNRGTFGAGGTRGFYQVTSANINGGSGIGGTVGGRSS